MATIPLASLDKSNTSAVPNVTPPVTAANVDYKDAQRAKVQTDMSSETSLTQDSSSTKRKRTRKLGKRRNADDVSQRKSATKETKVAIVPTVLLVICQPPP